MVEPGFEPTDDEIYSRSPNLYVDFQLAPRLHLDAMPEPQIQHVQKWTIIVPLDLAPCFKFSISTDDISIHQVSQA